MPSAIKALATITLTSAQATVTFSSISSSYRDLRLVMTGTTGATDNVAITVNALSGSNMYCRVGLIGYGTGVTSLAEGDASYSRFTFYSAWTTSEVGRVSIDFLDYTATDKHKVAVSRADRAGSGTEVFAHRIASTAAISSLTVKTHGGNTYSAGTTMTLYGVSA